MWSRTVFPVVAALILTAALPAAAPARDDEAARPLAPPAPGIEPGSQGGEGERTTRDPLRREGTQWTIFFSAGIAQEINRSAEIDVITAGVRWSHLWARAGNGAFSGQPAFAVEVLPLMTFAQEPRAYGAGFNLLYEHHFAAGGSVVPIWRFGAGALFTDAPVPPRETEHNFSLLTGFGIDVPFDDGAALSLEYRFHHVSNADTGFRNPGINAHTLVVGITLP